MMLWKSVLFFCLARSCGSSAVPAVRALEQEGTSGNEPDADEERVRTDLVRLVPFDVQIAMSSMTSTINVYALRDIVTDWMTDSFIQKSESQGLFASEGNATRGITFNNIALELSRSSSGGERMLRQRRTQETGYELYTASYEGVSLWERRGLVAPMDPNLVELIQRATFLEKTQLLSMLQAAESFTGLGQNVVDVRAFVAPVDGPADPPVDDDDGNLEIIIIIAIVVACLAFGLLMFAVLWAWRTDQNKQSSQRDSVYKSTGSPSLNRNPDGTGSESDYDTRGSPSAKSPPPNDTARPPREISPQNTQTYPESVVSEDISTSLTAYYRTGMAGYGGRKMPAELNDAASMSSMDSYGYSLDGYAPSLSGGPTPMGYPATLGKEPVNGQVKNPSDDAGKEPVVKLPAEGP